MRTASKWLGFALVATGVAVFPFAIWFPGPWGTIALVLVILGCIVLVLVSRAHPGEASADEQNDRSDG